MARPTLSEADFVKEFERLGAAPLARKLGISTRVVYERRAYLETKLKRQLLSPNIERGTTRVGAAHPGRIELELKNGLVLVASDAHYWPGPASTAHRGFVRFCRDLRPSVVILNGDVVDMGAVSRHAPIGWEKQPTVQEEIETAQDRLQEIMEAVGKARRIWTLGNHDSRFETRLATIAPEYAKVAGVHLKDHFPLWEPCWSVFINDNVVIKHRFKGGIHAPHNNTMWAGRSIITGHLHSAQVRPFNDYDGTRYGVDTGCLANADHAAFEYMEDNPRNWRSAFAVLTFNNGRLMQPELALKWDDNHMEFRGELVAV